MHMQRYLLPGTWLVCITHVFVLYFEIRALLIRTQMLRERLGMHDLFGVSEERTCNTGGRRIRHSYARTHMEYNLTHFEIDDLSRLLIYT
jgi:hypothetical protein